MRIKVVTKESMPAVWVKRTTAVGGMNKTFGDAFAAVTAFLTKKGVACEFAPFGLYRECDWEAMNTANPLVKLFTGLFKKWKIEIGYPVAKPLTGEGEVIAGVLPAGKYLEVLHQGPYSKVGETYKAVYAFAKEKNITLKDFAIESYLNCPKTVKPEELQTRIAVAAE